jgi:Rps23 Pro-64 3,4-dihydroxylase Tpa1-like proline 4-hydroxylase|eukprot:COSAG01_NODE_200_length_22187_cov_59.140529_3_plen_129_part_00
MVHTDRAGSFTEGARRRVAFVLHLTKDWESRLGGDLVFMHPPTFVTPTFNALTLFSVSRTSWHFVSPVVREAPPHLKRLAFSGWWMSTDAMAAMAKEDERDDAEAAINFVQRLDGRTGGFMAKMRITK